MNNKNISEEIAKLLLKIGAMTFRFDPPYTYTSGLKSPVYLDNRLIISYPDVRKKIINYYVQTIKERISLDNVDWISATATAAIPHGAWVADALNLPMVFVRPTTKTYGKGGKVEGHLKKGSKVLIIEDHISTAESVSSNAQSIRELGGSVEYCVATTTYDTKKSRDNLKAANIKLIALTTGKIIVETAYKIGKLTKDQKEKVDAWFADPPNWAKKMGLE
ncbi:orotate phosphoribosyltransferase [Candidatus Gottesmanbacteria bacterium RIFCSPHIGHO2_01_FULL_39_10]|uniref:Orotate phosphoribosyltransferase n=1 Tax=Candidatus Gottesmanbacteria bacterium RIFCSPHIGHO2_01_FULL_39_10 TaxID=1798375 RepID=A0A1F5ZKK5_9BACT|nr:MAG: orotate phosphoribosyltransferase [Candidatus Gottesmanbacteria bacterium RIFCSPHIGHO2_01_FULL_39_10]